MTIADELTKTIRQARLGDEKALERLAELSAERLRGHVYRLTLDAEVTKDIVQETVLQMLKILEELKKTERFWPWLYNIALNNTRRYQRTRKRQERTARRYFDVKPDCNTSLEQMISDEVKQVVTLSMSRLKTSHRAVLSMRCYEQMSFEEISDSLSCSNVAARMLFYRAKRSLARQLSRHGLGKGAIVMALALFGKMTASSQAAAAQIAVTSATLKVGTGVTVATYLTTKTAIISIAAAGIITSATVVHQITNQDKNGVFYLAENKTGLIAESGKSQKSDEEFWYFFPDDPAGAVMIRTGTNKNGGSHRYQWLQNGDGNFRYDTAKGIVEKVNHRMWQDDFSVWQLPTDKPSLTHFIGKTQGQTITSESAPVAGGGWLVIIKGGEDGRLCRTTRHYNVLDEEYFRYNWPKGTKVVDRRDVMHTRGWTYFKIEGQINNLPVNGTGRIPFVYSKSNTHYPWLKLNIGTRFIADKKGKYLFRGLLRPWMGLHTIDTIRRDAAEQQLDFTTEPAENNQKTIITVSGEEEQLIYTIDMENDLIEQIEFTGKTKVKLNFTYLQQVDDIGEGFAKPARLRGLKSYRKSEITFFNLSKLISDN